MTLFVNILGIGLIFFIIFWFWLYKKQAPARIATNGIVDVIVDNGIFYPEHIEAHIGMSLTLRFLRKSPSNCAATLLFPDFDKSLELELGETRSITITPEKLGNHEFTCQMGMYRGLITVID